VADIIKPIKRRVMRKHNLQKPITIGNTYSRPLYSTIIRKNFELRRINMILRRNIKRLRDKLYKGNIDQPTSVVGNIKEKLLIPLSNHPMK
jgi:hypothetical protein